MGKVSSFDNTCQGRGGPWQPRTKVDVSVGDEALLSHPPLRFAGLAIRIAAPSRMATVVLIRVTSVRSQAKRRSRPGLGRTTTGRTFLRIYKKDSAKPTVMLEKLDAR